MATQDNAWLEQALVSIEKEAGTAYEFATITETIDLDSGDKDIEGIPTLGGGRVVKYTPEGDTSITLELYPTGVNGLAATPTGVANLFHGFAGETGSNTTVRDKFRVAILWTNDTTATSGMGASAASTSAQRFAIAKAYCTSHKTSFTDGIVKVTATFKCAAFNKTGTGNILEEEADNTALSTLSAYTSTTNFR